MGKADSAFRGKVWLIGAGPGDAGLLTVKGREALREADVVVYDHLVGKDVLAMSDRGQTFINVGKMAGHHPIPQDQINQILIREAGKGKKVARLKGGDPFLFGRGGEELEALARRHIPFEVIPGVTSPLAVPAYAGIPVTHRDYASSLHIVTGHKKNGGEDGINYQALVDGKGTLVFLMGVTALEDITARLLDAGMDKDMPAAVLQEGTRARQRQVVATVLTLAKEARQAKIEPPAIVVVGQVCRLSHTLSWYEKLPLAGMRVLLTRPREWMGEIAAKLRKRGAEVLEVPVIETVAIPDNERLQEAFGRLEIYDWIVFTSQTGVCIFFEALEAAEIDIRRLHSIRFAVIGEGTKNALRKRGIYADLMPKEYEGEALANLLKEQGISGARIMIPRASRGNRQLVPILEEAGGMVDDIPLYHTVYRECTGISMKEEIEGRGLDCVVFTSSSTVEGFAAISEGADYSQIKAACIGRLTARTAEKYGMDCHIAQKATVDDLVELVERIRKTDGKETEKITKQ